MTWIFESNSYFAAVLTDEHRGNVAGYLLAAISIERNHFPRVAIGIGPEQINELVVRESDSDSETNRLVDENRLADFTRKHEHVSTPLAERGNLPAMNDGLPINTPTL